jgi:hypothetical protein
VLGSVSSVFSIRSLPAQFFGSEAQPEGRARTSGHAIAKARLAQGFMSFSENARNELTTGRLHSLLADGSRYER